MILNELNNDKSTLKNIDELETKYGCEELYPIEFLNSFKINNFPSHKIKLKKNGIIILLRNLDSIYGLQLNKINCKSNNYKSYICNNHQLT